MDQPFDRVDSVADDLEQYAKELDNMARRCRIAARVVKNLRAASNVHFNYNHALKDATEWLKQNAAPLATRLHKRATPPNIFNPVTTHDTAAKIVDEKNNS